MRKLYTVFIVAQFVLAGMAFIPPSGEAAKIKPSGTIKFVLMSVRTPEAMEADNAVLQANGKMFESKIVPFRPTTSMDDYKAAKSAANACVTADTQGETSAKGAYAPPSYVGPDIEGVNGTEAGGWRPPDTHGAVGPDHFVEITNSHYDVYRKSDGVRVESVSLASFFGYATQPLFDPRCVYDSAEGRWIVSSEAFEESATVQRHFIAVSKTTDPTGAFYVYHADVNFKDNDNFWDYPQIGVDKKSILITANIFSNHETTWEGADLGVVSKSSLYSGKTTTGKLFTKLEGTLAPPIVLDQSSKSCLVVADVFGNNSRITLYTLTYPKGAPKLTKSFITVPAFNMPPDVSQPGTTAKLDPLDARFVNASTQNGNSLWQIHTIKINNKPTPQWYEFNITKKTIIQSGNFSASDTSDDWNASIAANKGGDVFVTWSSTDATEGTNAQVRYSGRRSTDTSGLIDGGAALYTSSTYYDPSSDTVERWGDYSAVTIDPSNTSRAWIVNEKINSTSEWGSRITCIGY
ncbi:MAG: hypothetical protein AABY76_07575 [Planctomycetota bacterium]